MRLLRFLKGKKLPFFLMECKLEFIQVSTSDLKHKITKLCYNYIMIK